MLAWRNLHVPAGASPRCIPGNSAAFERQPPGFALARRRVFEWPSSMQLADPSSASLRRRLAGERLFDAG